MSEGAKRIICAVRGSPHSRATVTRAIDLALETGARLTFFYAVDVEFQAQAAIGSPLSVVYSELIEMSEFTMLILKDRAQRRGADQVDSIIRQGDVRKQLLGLIQEVQPDIVVVGWPLRGAGRPRFKPAEFEDFVAELEQEEHVRIEVAPAPPDSERQDRTEPREVDWPAPS
jgi:nucleotide-binding universal stress UspA family protein